MLKDELAAFEKAEFTKSKIATLVAAEISDPGQQQIALPETELSPLLSLSQPLKRLMAVQVESPAWFRLRH